MKPTFNLGDEVITTAHWLPRNLKGLRGTVVELPKSPGAPMGIDFGEELFAPGDGSRYTYSLNGIIPRDTGLWLDPEDVTLVKEAPKISFLMLEEK